MLVSILTEGQPCRQNWDIQNYANYTVARLRLQPWHVLSRTGVDISPDFLSMKLSTLYYQAALTA